MSNEIIEKLKQAIEDYKDNPEWEEVGKIIEVGDGIVKISGLSNVQSQEVLIIETHHQKIRALALNLEEDSVGALVLGDNTLIASGQTVKRTKEILSISVGQQLLGRVVDPLGVPLDGKGPLFSEKDTPISNPLENNAPNVLARESVNQPFHTGIKAIDSMIPIGRGQRELIIGDRQTGKTAIALDMIINQGKESANPPICIYVAIGQKESKIARIVEILRENNALDYTIVVSASASSPAAFWYLAPFAGCAIGEYFRDSKQDALIIYDDLSKHAWAYRQISLLLRRPPGREAYPGDVFYLHSRLLERAAKLSKENGGGSLTAIPIIETQLGDGTAYIPTNVISITDGQIYLESDLFYQGTRPAVNVGLSVSRVGSSAQTKAMKKVSGKIKLELAQFRELEAFMQFSSDLDAETKTRIDNGRKYVELLKQDQNAPVPFYEQAVSIYAANQGLYNGTTPENVREIEAGFVAFIKRDRKEIFSQIEDSRELSDDVIAALDTAIVDFKDAHSKYY